jgi:ribosomal protein L3
MRNKAISTGRERHRSRIFRNGLQSGSSGNRKRAVYNKKLRQLNEFDGRTVLGFLVILG